MPQRRCWSGRCWSGRHGKASRGIVASENLKCRIAGPFTGNFDKLSTKTGIRRSQASLRFLENLSTATNMPTPIKRMSNSCSSANNTSTLWIMRIPLRAIMKLGSRLWASAPRLRGNRWKACCSDAIDGGNKERGGKPEMGENSEVYSWGPGGDGQIKRKIVEILTEGVEGQRKNTNVRELYPSVTGSPAVCRGIINL